jgi:hypothetical protein
LPLIIFKTRNVNNNYFDLKINEEKIFQEIDVKIIFFNIFMPLIEKFKFKGFLNRNLYSKQ